MALQENKKQVAEFLQQILDQEKKRKQLEEEKEEEEIKVATEKAIPIELYRKLLNIKIDISIEPYQYEIEKLIAKKDSMDRGTFLQQKKGNCYKYLLLISANKIQ